MIGLFLRSLRHWPRIAWRVCIWLYCTLLVWHDWRMKHGYELCARCGEMRNTYPY